MALFGERSESEASRIRAHCAVGTVNEPQQDPVPTSHRMAARAQRPPRTQQLAEKNAAACLGELNTAAWPYTKLRASRGASAGLHSSQRISPAKSSGWSAAAITAAEQEAPKAQRMMGAV